MRMRMWTRECNMLMTMVIFLSLCISSRHVVAETELEVLEEVRDALSHADRSLEALSDLVNEVMTEGTSDTTTTKSSTSATTTAGITTPKTTTTTSPANTATTASATSPASTLTPITTTPPTTITVATPPTTATVATPPTTTTVATPPTTTIVATPPTTTIVATPPTTTTVATPPTTTTVGTPPTTTTVATPPTTTTIATPPTTTTVATPPTTTTVTTINTTITTTTPATTTTTTTPTTTITPITTTTVTTPPTTTTVTTQVTTETTSSDTTATITTPTTTMSTTTTPTSSLNTSIFTAPSTEGKDRSLADLSKDFLSVLRLVKIWNSARLFHARAAQGTHGPLAGDVSPFPPPIALAKQSTDSEHYKKQKIASGVDPFTMAVLTESLNELISELPSDAWGTRVNECLRVMENVVTEITGGSVDMTHAQQLEEEANIMDELVEEGRNDTSLLLEGELDFGLLDSVQENVNNASHMVDEMVSNEKADNTEMVVTIVMLSLLFVVVLTGLIVAFARPWAKKSGLKSSRSKWVAGSEVAEDVRPFPDARFMQHSHVYTDPYRSHDSKV